MVLASRDPSCFSHTLLISLCHQGLYSQLQYPSRWQKRPQLQNWLLVTNWKNLLWAERKAELVSEHCCTGYLSQCSPKIKEYSSHLTIDPHCFPHFNFYLCKTSYRTLLGLCPMPTTCLFKQFLACVRVNNRNYYFSRRNNDYSWLLHFKKKNHFFVLKCDITSELQQQNLS